MKSIPSDPILTCEESLVFEKEFFGGDEEREWQAMNKAGEGVGDALLRDMRELRTIPHRPRLLALVGKGHNGGDALIATKRFLRTIPTARAVVVSVAKWEVCRPLTIRSWEELKELAEKRITEIHLDSDIESNLSEIRQCMASESGFDASIDGLLGMQAKLPLRSPLPKLITFLNEEADIRVRCAVDLPTGITEEVSDNPLRADFTYSTGIVKKPVVNPANAEAVGRLRYLDLGFFSEKDTDISSSTDRVLRPSYLKRLRVLRNSQADKRDHGHLLALVGSRELGGAAMMSVQAALKAGVGLITVGIPESLHASFVAQRPEAMWVPLPETPTGGLALEALGKVRSLLDRASALLAGPGLGTDRETQSLLRETLSLYTGPVLLDADALQPELLTDISSPERLVLTPHAGEYQRISQGVEPESFAQKNPSVLVLKGTHTRVLQADQSYHCLGGSTVLARGGSGDLLAGIIGSLLASGNHSSLESTLLGVTWHGRAAEVLARQNGQLSVYVTDLLDNLSFAVRNDF